MTLLHPNRPHSVTIRLFAAARDRAGADTVAVELQNGATIGELRGALAEAFPSLRPLAPSLLFAVGTEYASDDTLVPQGGEVVAFPPVSGG
jgi:molybdopterin converting factor small subunit